ncbi:integrase [Catenulispora sp. GAS73]|uniref:tyrosine-type recombinase/integrase n=1 Tax=Catenulispora sp. GAS73 TaxID=3156269 RepID=UPI0035163964
MSAAAAVRIEDPSPSRWVSPLAGRRFDTEPLVRAEEAEAIVALGVRNLRRLQYHDPAAPGWRTIRRLTVPAEAVNAGLDSPPTPHRARAMLDVVAMLLTRCAETGRTFWAWTPQEWTCLLGRTQTDFRRDAPSWAGDEVRPYLAAHAWLLGGFREFHDLRSFQRLTLSWRIFGRDRVDAEIARIRAVLTSWGYKLGEEHDTLLPAVVSQVFLHVGSPHLEDLTTEVFDQIRTAQLLPGARANTLFALQRAIAALGFCDPPMHRTGGHSMRASGGPVLWEQWVDRWHATSTLTPRARGAIRSNLLKVGRWAADQHPEAADPTAWTRATCAAWIAATDRMSIGDYVQRTVGLKDSIGKPLNPATKAGRISALRRFFLDAQEWEWLPRRFDPYRTLATPRSIAALLGPNPRVIADEIWAKLLWAGLNLTEDDLPVNNSGFFYPIELVRAVTLTWLFSGQRSDEIARLRLGCIRWQHDGHPIAGDADVLADDAVCLLDVPAHKTGTSFSKPVDPLLGQAIDAWSAVRPDQPRLLDRRTGEMVHPLFAIRARRVSVAYINNTVIPMLTSKAGVPAADFRGNITSHRARSTIASQLYNAKEPMTLFELQAWLGHRSPQSTAFYAKISPKTLTRAYDDACYFARNVRTIEVLIDRDAVATGAATTGKPWQHYDLGHGFCSYSFFEQCQHRMACAKCDFYTPKDSTRGQLLEAKDNLQRMLAAIPLSDDERAAVDDGQTALDNLLERLTDVPTPAGPTPRQIGIPAQATLLPVIAINREPV